MHPSSFKLLIVSLSQLSLLAYDLVLTAISYLDRYTLILFFSGPFHSMLRPLSDPRQQRSMHLDPGHSRYAPRVLSIFPSWGALLKAYTSRFCRGMHLELFNPGHSGSVEVCTSSSFHIPILRALLKAYTSSSCRGLHLGLWILLGA